MPLIYEINIEVSASIADEFEQWLQSYIQRALELRGFLKADFYQRNPQDEEQSPLIKLWTIHFTLKDRQSYEDYVSGLSIQIQKEVTARFQDKYSATRRLLGLHLSRIKKQNSL